MTGNELAHFSPLSDETQTHTWTAALNSDNKQPSSSSQSVASGRGYWVKVKDRAGA